MRGHIYKAVEKDEGEDKSGMGLDSTNPFNALKRAIIRQSTREHNEHLLAIFEVAYKYPAPLVLRIYQNTRAWITSRALGEICSP